MPDLVTDRSVLYPAKAEAGRAWFLLFRRAPGQPGAGTWEPVYADLREGEGSARAAVRVLVEQTALQPLALWALDHVETGYDPGIDALRLMPCFVALVAGEVLLSPVHDASRWFSATEAANVLTSEPRRRSVEAAQHGVGAALSRDAEPDPRLRIV